MKIGIWSQAGNRSLFALRPPAALAGLLQAVGGAASSGTPDQATPSGTLMPAAGEASRGAK